MKKLGCLALATAASIGCGEDASNPHLWPLAGAPRFGVVGSDRTSASISLLGAEGEVVAEGWLDSGASSTGLVTTLSGDVVLPAQPTEMGVLSVLDRKDTDVLTRIRLPEGEVLGQVKTHRPVSEGTDGMATAFGSNPHDYVFVDESTAWVTRHTPNLNPDAPAINRGNDMLEIDPTNTERTGERIDFSALNTTGAPMPEEGEGEEVTVYARPSRVVTIGDFAVVGLARLGADFDVAGEGMVAIVDLQARTVEGLVLSGLANCGSVHPVAGADDEALVSCQGFARPYNDLEQLRMTSGLVVVSVDEDGEAGVAREWRAAEHPDAEVTVRAVTSLGEGRVVAGVYGDSGEGTPDRMYVVDMRSGEQTLLFETESQYEIGEGAYEPERGLLLLPDASTGVRRFRVDADEVRDVGLVGLANAGVLPPRSVTKLD